ncbi:MAG: hypothetical protein K1X92_08250 [Bacteroidia bacterium]|nr:hypothetical protein [Bacteroidia bacterium]
MSLLDSKNVKIIDIHEENRNPKTEDINLQNLPEINTEQSVVTQKEVLPEPVKEKKKHYGWAFFLASMFTGIAIGEALNADSFVLLGMGMGFLFFVDPIYQKVMDKIEKL